MAKRILIIDDDTLLRRSLAFSLERAGYHVETAGSAEDGLALAEQNAPDLVIMDIGLPGMDGLEAIRQFEARFQVPVIFLTARGRGAEEVLGLELGAEDYITKPFDPDVLIARVRTVLRRDRARPKVVEEGPLTAGDITVDPLSRSVTVAGRPVQLTPRAFDLLYALAREPGRLLSPDELLARVWGAEFTGQPQLVYVHMRWLREKLEEDPHQPRRLLTVNRVGYKLVPQEE